MVTRRITRSDKEFQKRLGERIAALILKERGFSSLDAFSLEHHEVIAKPTLYQICEGKRDMKLSTLRGLARALGISLQVLIQDL